MDLSLCCYCQKPMNWSPNSELWYLPLVRWYFVFLNSILPRAQWQYYYNIPYYPSSPCPAPSQTNSRHILPFPATWDLRYGTALDTLLNSNPKLYVKGVECWARLGTMEEQRDSPPLIIWNKLSCKVRGAQFDILNCDVLDIIPCHLFIL